jgi:TRAP transporter 4TM/12TM fusion protein
MADPKRSPDAPPAAFAETGPRRELKGAAWRIVAAIALAFSAYQLVIAAFAPLSSLVTRSLHVGFLLLLALLTHPVSRHADRHRIAWYDALLGCVAFALAFYHWIFEADIIQRGEPILPDLLVGTTIVVLLFDAARRVLGPALPIVCATFLAYGLFGQYLPSVIAHRGFGFDQVIGQLYLGTEGIYGIPTLVSATYIFLFILFGSFLEHAGMIGLFNSIALGFVGHARGGPAKVAVISSGMMGTISGSGIANVLTVGQFTIPLMKRFGYSSVFAGAVEATSSMGGQIMPPVMGAVAFIMAETLNVPYVTVVKAAVIPAILYYLTAFWMVHLEAGRAGLLGLAKAECPNPWDAIRRKWYLMLPLAVLVIMLFDGFTPMFAGLVGLSLTAILILGVTATAAMGAAPFRYAFWIALGVGLAAYLKLGFDTYGVTPILLLIAALIAVSLVIRGGLDTLAIMRKSLVDGATQAIPVGLACAIVGVIIGVLTLTGAASNFAEFVLEVGSKSLFLSLFLTMAVCLVLGMGIPTIPNYIITSAIAAPALLKLGVPLIVSHMFVFYFGIMADLTPPVALAAFAAASIAKASPMRIGWKATHIAIAGFVIPYMAVYDPALMLQGDSIVNTAYVVMKAVIAIGLWGGAAVGYLWSPLAWYERIVAMAAAFLLVVAIPWTDEAGFALGALFAAWHGVRNRSLVRRPRKAGGNAS